ncbi:MAG: hypothetical protein WKG00_38330 [Polyangiaceae bacterium]
MRHRSIAGGLVVGAMLCAAGLRAANAQDADVDNPPPRKRGVGERLQLAIGADLGFAHYSRIQGNSDVGLGPAWQVRVGAQVRPWLSIDARYMGARHDAVGSLMAHAGSIEPRFSIPWKRIRPYASIGLGLYSVYAYDADGNAIVEPDPALQMPTSLGVEVMLLDRLGIQAEGSYRFLFDKVVPEEFARTQIWNGTLGARVYF